MNFEGDEFRSKYESCQAKLTTIQDQQDRLKEDTRYVLETFAARKKSDGSFDIDFDKFIERLGLEKWIELRAIGDEHYRVSGAAGEKPRIKVAAEASA